MTSHSALDRRIAAYLGQEPQRQSPELLVDVDLVRPAGLACGPRRYRLRPLLRDQPRLERRPSA